jgi:hypothetical protein
MTACALSQRVMLLNWLRLQLDCRHTIPEWPTTHLTLDGGAGVYRCRRVEFVTMPPNGLRGSAHVCRRFNAQVPVKRGIRRGPEPDG